MSSIGSGGTLLVDLLRSQLHGVPPTMQQPIARAARKIEDLPAIEKPFRAIENALEDRLVSCRLTSDHFQHFARGDLCCFNASLHFLEQPHMFWIAITAWSAKV